MAYPDVHLADLDLTGSAPTVSAGVASWLAVPTALTADGAAAFGDFYAAGAELAPLSFAVPETCRTTQGSFSSGLEWGAKTSFLNYLQGPVAHGLVACADGAAGVRNPTSKKITSLRFVPRAGNAYDAGTGVITAGFDGRMRFSGHDYGQGPILDLEFSHLRIRSTDGVHGELVADVQSVPFVAADPNLPPPDAEETPDVVLADVDLGAALVTTAPDGTRTWANATVTLTNDGETAFGGFYGAGTAMDPLTFTAPPAGAGAP